MNVFGTRKLSSSFDLGYTETEISTKVPRDRESSIVKCFVTWYIRLNIKDISN